MSRFDRHPTNIPIEVKSPDQSNHDKHSTSNLSMGGLAFHCDRKFEPEHIVEIRIPFVSPPFEVKACVRWCSKREHDFEVGVQFLNPDDAFMAHMVEQVCHIENYKKERQQKEGRVLSSEEAALEWISKYADKFPETEDPK